MFQCSSSDRKTVVTLASENSWKKTNKREKNSGFRGWKCCITGCRGIINGLRFLACLKLIFEFAGRFSPLCACFFEQEREGTEGQRAGDVREAESLRFWGFCRPWAAALSMAGLYSCSCAQVGIPTPFPQLQWGHLGTPGTSWRGLDPKFILGKYKWLVLPRFQRALGWVPLPSSSWDRTLAKQEWASHKCQVSGVLWVGILCGCQIYPGVNQAKLSIKQKTI